ncbi:MAG TPA: hypothetical protein VF759_11255 [Allosphingosinicella sp.]|jgi:hypothetical protein
MTAGSILAGAFGLVRERPGAVAVWALVYLAASVGVALAMRPLLGTFAQLSGAAAPSPDEMSTAMARLVLVEMAFVAVVIALFAAAQRAVLRPAQQGFAFLRLGMDELRMFGLALLFLILFYFGLIVATLVLGLLAVLVGVVAGAAAVVPLVVVEVIALLAALFWLQVRLSLAFPLTMLRGKIVIGESWQRTRGRFWSLFGAFFLLFLLVLAMWIPVALVGSGGYFADLVNSGFTPEGVQRAGERQMARQFGTPDPTMMIGWALGAVVGTLGIALFSGAAATAARELTDDVEGLAETFA